jgi:hypothetical protein
MKNILSRASFSLGIITLCVASNLPASAQSQRYATNEEVNKLRQEFHQRIPKVKGFLKSGAGFGRDRRTQADFQNRQNFIQAWSRISPNAAHFLGEWSGQEN